MSTPEQIAADAIADGCWCDESSPRDYANTAVAALREAGMFVDLDATETRLTPEQVAHIKVEREEARAERDALAAQLEAARQAADDLLDLDEYAPAAIVAVYRAALRALLAPVEPQPEPELDVVMVLQQDGTYRDEDDPRWAEPLPEPEQT